MLRFVTGATRGFRCCVQNCDSQMPSCAATEPWQHLPSLGDVGLNSKVPLMHAAHRSSSAFQGRLVQKEWQEALGKVHERKDMEWSCRS